MEFILAVLLGYILAKATSYKDKANEYWCQISGSSTGNNWASHNLDLSNSSCCNAPVWISRKGNRICTKCKKKDIK